MYKSDTDKEDTLRIRELMAKLEKVQAEEAIIKSELRALVYKIEKGR